MSKKKPSSSALVWNFKNERFEFLYDVWNVDRAKQIIKDKSRPIFEVELEPLRALVGRPGQILFMGVAVNWKKAQSDIVDLSVPILMAYGRSKFLPIDGWHRIAKALLEGRKTLPAVKLTQAESRTIHQYTGLTRKPRKTTRRRR